MGMLRPLDISEKQKKSKNRQGTLMVHSVKEIEKEKRRTPGSSNKYGRRFESKTSREYAMSP